MRSGAGAEPRFWLVQVPGLRYLASVPWFGNQVELLGLVVLGGGFFCRCLFSRLSSLLSSRLGAVFR